MSDTHYKTLQICIKKGHRLFSYFHQMGHDAKNVYNVTNFYIRQVYTALRQDRPLQPLQKEVLDTINQYIEEMNKRQISNLSIKSLERTAEAFRQASKSEA